MTPIGLGLGLGLGFFDLRGSGSASPSLSQSTIVANPSTLNADGVSTSTITVQLKTAGGANYPSSGGTVVLSALHGTLGAVTDNSNGTYTATFTAPASGLTDTVSGTLGGQALTNTATVTLVPVDFTTGLTRWWKTSQLSQSDNTDILSWTASSPATVAATGSAGVVPKYRTNIVNSQPAASFNGSSQILDFTEFTLAGDFTIMIVQATSGDCTMLSDTSGNRQIRIGDSGNNRLSAYAGGADNPVSSALSTTHDTAHFSVIEMVRSGTTVSFFENGTAKSSGTMSSGGADSLSLNRIGNNGFVSAGYVTGYLAEIRIWSSAVSSGNRSSARAFLGYTYGISVS